MGDFAVAALYERRKCRGINTGGHRPPLQKVVNKHRQLCRRIEVSGFYDFLPDGVANESSHRVHAQLSHDMGPVSFDSL